jgi:hypothetical protein
MHVTELLNDTSYTTGTVYSRQPSVTIICFIHVYGNEISTDKNSITTKIGCINELHDTNRKNTLAIVNVHAKLF